MDYKATINLPKTDFSMKADLPKKEPAMLAEWQKADLYDQVLKARQGSPSYILHDGPPYANGDIHIGHALNKILKDIVVKYKTMRGYRSPYVPGWDCHGLPVEHQLFKELKLTKYEIGQVEFRKKAHAYAMKYVSIQRDQFKRLGIFGNWEDPYLTLSKEYESEIIRAFGKLAKGGYIYKGLKPVNWCYSCETALAEAEVEYKDRASPSVYVKFRVTDFKGQGIEEAYFIIWTTTPWTLVANVAIAVHPDFDYAFIKGQACPAMGDDGQGGGAGGIPRLRSGQEGQGEVWVIMKDLVASVMAKAEIKDYEIMHTVSGKRLEGIICRHPFLDRDSKVVLADYVSNIDGTGCVHTAPGHGQEDYRTGITYGLPTVMPVDTKGTFDNTAGEFAGLNVHKADTKIIERMREDGSLIMSEAVTHSYPHCWRCKSPIIFRTTPQWFMNIDHDNLRKRMLDTIAGAVTWVPATGRGRIAGMVEHRPDWCLSRQRFWGVPIVAFYCAHCNKELLDAGVIDRIADMVEKDGADVWFIKKESELLPAGTRCSACGKGEFRKETDIIDVWFDSGVSHQAVLKKRKELSYPCDLYLEGSDQHRGWFQSALITAMGIDNAAPFKTVLTHGFVVDGEGRKMSKSQGNVISPHDIIKEYGADILRLWVASSDYREDVRLSDQIVTRLADAYRKIRNTYRFILGNLSDFVPARDAVDFKEMCEIDRWAVSEAHELLEQVTNSYETFSFHDVFHAMYNFCVIELSSFYLDILKDRLYISQTTSMERRSGQTALFEILTIITKTMAPILVFTADEANRGLYKDKASSVHAAEWPDVEKLRTVRDDALKEKWCRLVQVRQEVTKALELEREKGVIGSSLEARVVLKSPDAPLQNFLRQSLADLATVFIVSKVEVTDAELTNAVSAQVLPLAIAVGKAPGTKCVRCWNYSESVGSDSLHPSLCERCAKVVRGEDR